MTPTLWITDEFENIGLTIEPDSDQAINRALCEDRLTEYYPQISIANTAEKATRLYDEPLGFFDVYSMPEIEEIYNTKYQDNVAGYRSGMTK